MSNHPQDPGAGCPVVGEPLSLGHGPRPLLECALPAHHEDPWHQAPSGIQWLNIVQADECPERPNIGGEE